ncbi:MAG: ribonuclease H family protein [Pseudoflavonifractor sp.]|nr:ribonuclease H family protein [Pseudoflavonifractor sp.]
MSKRKYYVVWAGFITGIYDTWEECKAQVQGFPGAKYRSFSNLEDATRAYRGDPSEHIGVLKAIASHRPTVVNYEAFPEIVLDSIAVDAACSGNPGPVEYRGVNVRTGEVIFHVGPLEDGTNNVGEFLALVHALALLKRDGRGSVPIYSDSRTAQAWVRDRHSKTKLAPTPRNGRVIELLGRANAWLAANTWTNPIIKWDTERWGEIPADFGRK